MSAGWSKLLDAGPLADGRTDIEFAIPVAEFPRVSPLLREATGEAAGEITFGRHGRLAVATVRVHATVVLTCQRCLGPLDWTLDGEGRVALVASEEEADRVPEQFETVMAEGHRISVRDLVEEELLLALPLVPRHALEQDCDGGKTVVESAESAAEVESQESHRPFGQLAQLLKRP